MRFAVPITAVLALWSLPALADITGTASVIDGDTMEIHGQRIRLHGIDAPESAQLCERDARTYRCGQKASLALADLIGRQRVRCAQKDVDRYGRIVAECFLGNSSLNAWMVAQGWAVAYRRYSRDYVDEEDAAREAGRELWSGAFVLPWDWRRGKRLGMAETKAVSGPDGCLIKGNISRSGERIYHVPGGRWYDRTRIDEVKGERWFCSEGEARAEGWRKSRQ